MRVEYKFNEVENRIELMSVEDFDEDTEIVDDVLTISIPKEIDGFPVLSIGTINRNGPSFFSLNPFVKDILPYNTIIKIEIPNTVKTIKMFTMPRLMDTIENAFEINIPKNVSKISPYAFERMTFSNFTFDKDINMDYISEGCFSKTKFYNTFYFPSCCKDIGAHSFESASFFKGFSFNNANIKKISEYAFSRCRFNMEELIIPDSVFKIEEKAFAESEKIRKVENTINSALEDIGYAAFEKSDIETFVLKHDKFVYLDESIFFDCRNLKILDLSTIHSKTIPNHFYCSGGPAPEKISVKLPNGLETIETSAFRCSNLDTIEIPETVSIIGNTAFSSAGLTNVKFKNVENLNKIGSEAFAHNKLTKIPSNFFDNICYCGHAVFAENKLKELTLNANTYLSKFSLFTKNPDLKKVSLVNTVKYKWIDISDNMFDGCINLEEINIPDTVKSFGFACFKDTSLKTISAPNLAYMSSSVFENCSSLESCDFSNSTIDLIKEDTFKKATSLKEIKLSPFATTQVSKSAFYRWREPRIRKLFSVSPFINVV